MSCLLLKSTILAMLLGVLLFGAEKSLVSAVSEEASIFESLMLLSPVTEEAKAPVDGKKENNSNILIETDLEDSLEEIELLSEIEINILNEMETESLKTLANK